MEKQVNVILPTEASSSGTRLLGAQVDESIYWEFKKAAASRQETMADALTHAALMYTSIGGGTKND